MLELVRKFEEVNNLKLNYKIVGRRAGDIVAIWADPSYANNELGWRAERSLDETLAAAWNGRSISAASNSTMHCCKPERDGSAPDSVPFP